MFAFLSGKWMLGCGWPYSLIFFLPCGLNNVIFSRLLVAERVLVMWFYLCFFGVPNFPMVLVFGFSFSILEQLC